jgi:hypothetical protein
MARRRRRNKRQRLKPVLLQEHLEDVSGRLLDDPRHRALVRDLIRSRHGIYALYRQSRLYYVGLARNLMTRMKQHLKDRHRGRWDRFSVYLTVTSDHIKELESLVLRIASPDGNRKSGKFGGSLDLCRHLEWQMKVADATQRAHLLGGRVADRVRRARTRRGKGASALQGVVERRIPLRARWKGKRYSASLLPDGRISLRKVKYPSPSAAGAAVVGQRCNGWTFWRYRDDDGVWCQLSNLRR